MVTESFIERSVYAEQKQKLENSLLKRYNEVSELIVVPSVFVLTLHKMPGR
jgi:hypothetical protein